MMTPTSPVHDRRRAALLTAAALAAIAAAAAGCSRPLLSETDERTPFDRYDALRNQYSRQYVQNEFGYREPNLRGRLAPK